MTVVTEHNCTYMTWVLVTTLHQKNHILVRVVRTFGCLTSSTVLGRLVTRGVLKSYLWRRDRPNNLSAIGKMPSPAQEQSLKLDRRPPFAVSPPPPSDLCHPLSEVRSPPSTSVVGTVVCQRTSAICRALRVPLSTVCRPRILAGPTIPPSANPNGPCRSFFLLIFLAFVNTIQTINQKYYKIYFN